MKKLLYLGILFSGLLVLALGGWIVKGTRRLVAPRPTPRFA